MMGIKVLFVLAVLVYGVQSRELLGKLRKRQVSPQDYRSFGSGSPNVLGTISRDQQTGQQKYVVPQPQVAPQQPNQVNQRQVNYRPLSHQQQPQQHQQQQQYNNIYNQQRPQPVTFNSNAFIQNTLKRTPPHSQLLAIRTNAQTSLVSRLPSNATRIRPNIVEGFSCEGRDYGFYADVPNECQIFHVCYPLRKVFNNHPLVPDVTYIFSFICNEFTRFDQASMTCAWTYEATPCAASEQLYVRNQEFFKTTTKAPTGK